MLTNITIDELRAIIAEAVHNALKDTLEIEFMKLRAEMLPYITAEEQQELEGIFPAPASIMDAGESLEIDLA